MSKFSKYQIATAVAIIFHVIGIMGILFYDTQSFINATPINLLLSFALLIWTEEDRNKYFWIFLLITVSAGFFVEVVGVNTGALFGDYGYGDALGYRYLNVPVIIGLNWFIIIYCSGISLNIFLVKLINKLASESNTPPKRLKMISVIVDGATVAVLMDMVIEPAAIKMGLWKWGGDGSVPMYNYVCWFLFSILLLTIFQFCNFKKQNKFAVNLLLIQAMFFLILRTFMK
ncbi:MAG: carotenoid biosynthesis protein [Bacteroidota bacterium]